ncbi:hypothetical protein ACJJTC_013640 [Scirpophaga incertulas]
MDDGFEKGQSDNLPKIYGLMVAYYLTKNSDFVAAEMRGVKMQRSVRDNYGDDAIGYVQVKRVGNICTVKCRITPEHRVRATPYHCILECDEKDNEILNVMCKDCAASSGGCNAASPKRGAFNNCYKLLLGKIEALGDRDYIQND